ncbi:RDD family protein [Mesorhizobium sp. VK23B]|uniref:RDD family protein n=1 Tax=Mesorhizobium dulcispinae TaxID=3072316 RepID=A0ABU4X9F2_9HYPH|nr:MULTISPECIES: RDD family protein [unclassified Mesorhizobium]MDX8465761.1 RDD family protein [Mesorhizobium sp. VK23B]MDX8471437.1 RDD family protein [Mesorhizobium sp. VK23A]
MTDEGIQLAAAMAWPRLGGFWRRLLASLIDYFVVLVPVYSLVTGLFLFTDGGVKGHFWLNWRICSTASVHGNPSLEAYNWQVCKTSLLGFPVAEWAIGTAKDTQSEAAPAVSLDLDPQGNFRPTALDLGFLELPILAIYLLVMEMASGQSVGKRVLSLVVHDEYDWHRTGLSLQKAARRQVIKFLGAVPVTLTGAWFAFQAWRSMPGLVSSYSKVEIVCAFAAFALALIWPIWIGLSIASGNEPIHDRVADTSVRISEIHE